MTEGHLIERICSKVFDNREFAFLKLTVDRPLRLNFKASADRISRLKNESAFIALAVSKKRKDNKTIAKEVEEGHALQEQITEALSQLDSTRLYRNRAKFKADLDRLFERSGLDLATPVYRNILAALSERDPTADICIDAKGNPEPDPDLRDTESVPLPRKLTIPLPIGYKGADGKEPNNDKLVALVRVHCDAYLNSEVKPHWPDAWIDYSKTKIGYEIPVNRYFYVYEPPRPLTQIEAEIKRIEGEIIGLLEEIA